MKLAGLAEGYQQRRGGETRSARILGSCRRAMESAICLRRPPRFPPPNCESSFFTSAAWRNIRANSIVRIAVPQRRSSPQPPGFSPDRRAVNLRYDLSSPSVIREFTRSYRGAMGLNISRTLSVRSSGPGKLGGCFPSFSAGLISHLLR